VDASVLDAAGGALNVAVVRPLREGGQKAVALATRDGEPVVLKVVGLEGDDHERILERARREVELLGAIDHPNIVRLESTLTLVGQPPIAVAWLEEFLDGRDLADALGLQWSWDATYRMLHDLAFGLAALHAVGVVHRDLSPNNVRQRADGSYCVMDPGYARWIGRSTLTGLAQPGTVGYLSPEHVSQTVRPSFASDVFCIGILAFECLTGDVPIPFRGDLVDYASVLRTRPAPRIGTLRPDLSEQQQRLVDVCLERQAARRFQDASELLNELTP
jgi:eukaryotic-like serine/threonine-protein kinase